MVSKPTVFSKKREVSVLIAHLLEPFGLSYSLVFFIIIIIICRSINTHLALDIKE